MKPKVEPLHLLPDESFRLLRWNALDVTDVEVLGANGKTHSFKGAGNVWHCHPGMELVLITRGAGTRFVGDSIAGFQATDLVLLGPNLPHYWHTTRSLAGYALQFGPGTEQTLWNLPEMKRLSPLWQNAQQGIRFTGPVAAKVAAGIKSMPGRGGIGRVARFLLVLEQLQHAAHGSWKLLSQNQFPASADPLNSRGIQKAIHRILSSFHEQPTLTDIVQASGMSKATFERQFKQHTGKTFTRFLTEVRIHFVRHQLIETGLSISEIAFAAGFNNLSHFNHQFSLIHKEPPGAFRQRMRGKVL